MAPLRLISFKTAHPSRPTGRCVAIDSKRGRCRALTKDHLQLNIQRGRINLADTLTNLSTICMAREDLVQLLSTYAHNCLCSLHRQQKCCVNEAVALWTKQIELRLILEVDNSSYHECTTSMCVREAAEDLAPGPDNQNSMVRDFSTVSRTSHASTYVLLCGPVNGKELGSGNIYMYSRPHETTHVKIGVTTQDVSTRMRNVEQLCGYKPVLHFSVKDVPNVHRVERLIFTELKCYRRFMAMCFCGTSHGEWFEIDADRAGKVTKDWANWFIKVKPYDRSGKMRVPAKSMAERVLDSGKTITAKRLIGLVIEREKIELSDAIYAQDWE